MNGLHGRGEAATMLGEVLTDAGMATIDGMVRELNDLAEIGGQCR